MRFLDGTGKTMETDGEGWTTKVEGKWKVRKKEGQVHVEGVPEIDGQMLATATWQTRALKYIVKRIREVDSTDKGSFSRAVIKIFVQINGICVNGRSIAYRAAHDGIWTFAAKICFTKRFEFH